VCSLSLLAELSAFEKVIPGSFVILAKYSEVYLKVRREKRRERREKRRESARREKREIEDIKQRCTYTHIRGGYGQSILVIVHTYTYIQTRIRAHSHKHSRTHTHTHTGRQPAKFTGRAREKFGAKMRRKSHCREFGVGTSLRLE